MVSHVFLSAMFVLQFAAVCAFCVFLFHTTVYLASLEEKGFRFCPRQRGL